MKNDGNFKAPSVRVFLPEEESVHPNHEDSWLEDASRATNIKLQCVRNSLILSNKKRRNKNLYSTIKLQSAYVYIDDRLTGYGSMDSPI
jgi:hypothetical protein